MLYIIYKHIDQIPSVYIFNVWKHKATLQANNGDTAFMHCLSTAGAPRSTLSIFPEDMMHGSDIKNTSGHTATYHIAEGGLWKKVDKKYYDPDVYYKTRLGTTYLMAAAKCAHLHNLPPKYFLAHDIRNELGLNFVQMSLYSILHMTNYGHIVAN